MAEIILFHHALGPTAGVHAFADRLRDAGHSVAVPDLFEGATFDILQEGVAHAQDVGMDTIIDRGVAAAAEFPERVVYAGFSLGALPAQQLAQTRPGALAAVFYHGGDAPASAFGGAWPDPVPIQLHVGEQDEWVELDVARELVKGAADAELFMYPSSAHLFTDSSLDEYDPDLTAVVVERTLRLLSRVG